MNNIKVVIGAGYGDEGKGRMVSYLAKKHDNTLVVLANGSAQRAHTVVDNGKRHVFHHFGSGTMSGAHTYCDFTYIVNLFVFRKEYEKLKDLGYKPKVYVNAKCQVATPWDAIINQIWETSLGDNRYGSCGLGVYESIERNDYTDVGENSEPLRPYACYAGYLNFDEKSLTSLFTEIQAKYVPMRLKYILEGKPIPEEYISVLEKDYVNAFLNDVQFFKDHVTIVKSAKDLPMYDSIIYECGQGLAIQQENEQFGENVTPSNTGCINPLFCINMGDMFDHLKNSNDMVELIYTTRWYTTRHGAGNLRDECQASDLSNKIADKTNTPNPWQQSIRYAPLDCDILFGRIVRDIADSRENFDGKHKCVFNLAITCLDQVEDNNITAIINGIKHHYGVDKFLEIMEWYMQAFNQNPKFYLCNGEDSDDASERLYS